MSETDADGGPQRVLITLEELAEELMPIVKAGLPVRPDTAGERLPYFAICLAHASGTDHLARVIGLDMVLTEIVRAQPRTPTGEAIRILFGLPPADRSWSLTRRQIEAAQAANYSPDHFRRNIFQKLIDDIAYEFVRRNAAYKPRPTRPLREDDVEQSMEHPDTEGADLILLELQSRALAHIYGARADLIAARRDVEHSAAVARSHALSGLWQTAQLYEVTAEYVKRYGTRVLLGREEIGVDRMTHIAGWHPPFTDNEARRLQIAAAAASGRDEFVAGIEANEPEIIAKWLDYAFS